MASYEYRDTPFTLLRSRSQITGEVDRRGIGQNPDYPRAAEWLGMVNMGGGKPLPADYIWPTNPNEKQEEEGHG
jgi:hypothetical protein